MRFSDLVKGGPYIGPRGGKWADPQHKIPWQEEKKRSLLGILRDFKFRPKKDKPNTKSRGMLRGLLTKDFGLLISKSSSLSTLMKFRGIFAAHVNEDVRTPKERKQGTTEPAKRTRDGYQNRNKTKTELTPKQMLALIDRRIAFLEGKKKEQEADKAPVAVDMTTGKVSTPDAQEKPDSDHLHEREDVPEGFPLDKSALEVLGKLAATSDKEKRREISFEFPAVVDALESAALVIFTSVKGWLLSDKGREFVDEATSEDNFDTMPESVSNTKSRYESREHPPRPSTQEILKQEGLSLAAATALFRYVESDQDELPDGPYGTKMTLKLVEQGFLEQGSVSYNTSNQIGRETFFKITDKGRKVAVDVRRNAIESAFEMAEDLKLKDMSEKDAYNLVRDIERKGSRQYMRGGGYTTVSKEERRLAEIAKVLLKMLPSEESPRAQRKVEESVEKLLADVQDPWLESEPVAESEDNFDTMPDAEPSAPVAESEGIGRWEDLDDAGRESRFDVLRDLVEQSAASEDHTTLTGRRSKTQAARDEQIQDLAHGAAGWLDTLDPMVVERLTSLRNHLREGAIRLHDGSKKINHGQRQAIREDIVSIIEKVFAALKPAPEPSKYNRGVDTLLTNERVRLERVANQTTPYVAEYRKGDKVAVMIGKKFKTGILVGLRPASNEVIVDFGLAAQTFRGKRERHRMSFSPRELIGQTDIDTEPRYANKMHMLEGWERNPTEAAESESEDNFDTMPDAEPSAPVDSVKIAQEMKDRGVSDQQIEEGLVTTKGEQIGRPEFLSWFKDSKVVGQDGEPEEQWGARPIKVFHGTSAGGFEEFDEEFDKGANLFGKGFYFTEDKEIAEAYTEKDSEKDSEDKAQVYEVFLSMQNPLDLDKKITQKDFSSLAEAFSSDPKIMVAEYEKNKKDLAEKAKQIEDILENPPAVETFNSGEVYKAGDLYSQDEPKMAFRESWKQTEASGLLRTYAKKHDVYDDWNKDGIRLRDGMVVPPGLKVVRQWSIRLDNWGGVGILQAHDSLVLAEGYEKLPDFKTTKRDDVDRPRLAAKELKQRFEESQKRENFAILSDSDEMLQDMAQGIKTNQNRLDRLKENMASEQPHIYGYYTKDFGEFFPEDRRLDYEDLSTGMSFADFSAANLKARQETKGQTYSPYGSPDQQRPVLGGINLAKHDDLTFMGFHRFITGMSQSKGGVDTFTQWAKDQGHDGIKHTGGWNIGSKEHAVWIAFEPNQVKATNAKSFDTSDNNIYKGMKSLQERDLAILIPEPPSQMSRVSELSKVSDQYRNRKCPEQMQDVLDSDMDSLFNALLMDAGLPSSMYMITGISRSIVAPIKIHKEYYGAMRPNVLAARHGVDFEYDHLESAQTPSYPSGHTTQAAYLAKVLGSIYPEIQSKLDKLASQIAESRIDRGVHLPSDNEAGRQLAQALFEKTNKQMRTGDVRYQEVFGG